MRETATLLSVGVPLLEAIEQQAAQHRGRFRVVLLDLRERVGQGQSLTDGFQAHPQIFDEISLAIARAGEDAGALDQALLRLSQFKERAQDLHSKVVTTLMYPGIVFVMATCITIFLMTYVVPSILAPLIEMGRPLPLATRIVQQASNFLVGWGLLCAVPLAILLLCCARILRIPRVRGTVDAAVLRTPIVGELVRKTLVLRIAVVLSTLLGSGVVFVHAIRIATATTRNSVIRTALVRCEEAVTAGSDIAVALASTAAFPPVVVHAFAIGQQSGQLPELLERLAENFDREIATATARMTAAIEPVLIVVLASIVLLIAMATMLPIMEVGDAMQ